MKGTDAHALRTTTASFHMAALFWVLAWTLTIIAILGNGLVIYLIATRHKLRSLANTFVFSLAVADLLFGASFCPSLSVCEFFPTRCNSIYRIAAVSLVALISNANLCAMVLDRYLAVVRPLKYTSCMTTRRGRILLCLAWGVPFVAFLLCYVTGFFSRAQTDRATESSFYVFLSYVEIAPCIVLLAMTARIFWIARQHGNQMAVLAAQLSYNGGNKRRRKKSSIQQALERSSAWMVAVTVLVFVVCYVIDIYYTSCTELKVCPQPGEALKCTLRLLLITNSAINPIAYAFLKKDIKRELRRTLCRRRRTRFDNKGETILTYCS